MLKNGYVDMVLCETGEEVAGEGSSLLYKARRAGEPFFCLAPADGGSVPSRTDGLLGGLVLPTLTSLADGRVTIWSAQFGTSNAPVRNSHAQGSSNAHVPARSAMALSCIRTNAMRGFVSEKAGMERSQVSSNPSPRISQSLFVFPKSKSAQSN